MWTRLIRYETDEGNIEYGEPVSSDVSADILDAAVKGRLTAKRLEGSNLFNLEPTNKVDKVGTLMSPLAVQDVPIIRCVGLNYKGHSKLRGRYSDPQALTVVILVLETGRELPENPTIFFKAAPCLADGLADITIPKIAQAQCDYEGELVIVIGKDAKDVPEHLALDYVAGYTCGNDLSSRDWQREPNKAGPVPQWCFSKSFDNYAPIGLCLVSTHVLGDASNLELRTTVNGELRQTANTSDLCHGVKSLVSFCSQGQTLQKGSLIMTGTPGGVGLFLKPPQFLKHGDLVVVEISQLGRICNRIVFE